MRVRLEVRGQVFLELGVPHGCLLNDRVIVVETLALMEALEESIEVNQLDLVVENGTEVIKDTDCLMTDKASAR